jgi:hypothetical protein
LVLVQWAVISYPLVSCGGDGENIYQINWEVNKHFQNNLGVSNIAHTAKSVSVLWL